MRKTYQVEQVRNDDGTFAPWYRIAIYVDGRRYSETAIQYSSKLEATKLCMNASLNRMLCDMEDKIYGVKHIY